MADNKKMGREAIEQIKEQRAKQEIDNLILVIYIVVPLALYINIISNLHVSFEEHRMEGLALPLSTFIFFLLSGIVAFIEYLAISILINNKTGVLVDIIFDINKIAIFSSILVFFITLLAQYTIKNYITIDLKKSALFIAVLYSLSFYLVLFMPLKILTNRFYDEEILKNKNIFI